MRSRRSALGEPPQRPSVFVDPEVDGIPLMGIGEGAPVASKNALESPPPDWPFALVHLPAAIRRHQPSGHCFDLCVCSPGVTQAHLLIPCLARQPPLRESQHEVEELLLLAGQDEAVFIEKHEKADQACSLVAVDESMVEDEAM